MSMRTCTISASVVRVLTSSASAAIETREELVHETTTSVELELTPESVICSHADYSSTFLKVLIPQLAAITLLDHQNTDAGAPCVAAGEDEIDHDAQTCATTLIERVDVVIRGVPFVHERYASLGTRPYGDCTGGADGVPVAPTDGDGKADGTGSGTDRDDDAPGAAGCAAGGGGGAGASAALMILGMVIAARRRARAPAR